MIGVPFWGLEWSQEDEEQVMREQMLHDIEHCRKNKKREIIARQLRAGLCRWVRRTRCKA